MRFLVSSATLLAIRMMADVTADDSQVMAVVAVDGDGQEELNMLWDEKNRDLNSFKSCIFDQLPKTQKDDCLACFERLDQTLEDSCAAQITKWCGCNCGDCNQGLEDYANTWVNYLMLRGHELCVQNFLLAEVGVGQVEECELSCDISCGLSSSASGHPSTFFAKAAAAILAGVVIIAAVH